MYHPYINSKLDKNEYMVVFNHLCLASYKMDTGKQCRPRSERGGKSGFTQFALNTVIFLKHGNNTNVPDTPSIENGPVRRVRVGKSTRQKWVDKIFPILWKSGKESSTVAGRVHKITQVLDEHQLRSHYKNIPTQLYRKVHLQKLKSFKQKALICFHSSAQNIDCGYSLEPTRWGGSNEYPQSMFLSKKKKTNV